MGTTLAKLEKEKSGSDKKIDKFAFVHIEKMKKKKKETGPGSSNPKRVQRNLGGRIGKKFGGGVRKNSSRMNKLEELGRVDSEKAYSSKGKRNLKAEKKRIVKSLNSRGAAKRGHGAEIR